MSASAKILIVEDEHVVALDVQRTLERLGYGAEVTFSGETAVQTAERQTFDLVLMDIKLRGRMDGIDTVKTLKAHRDIPVVYLTAYADDSTLERARATNPYGYLLKPFRERELKAAIETALHRHQLDQVHGEEYKLQRFLADASAELAATLDYRAVAERAADLMVPRYADWCEVHLREVNDTIPPLVWTEPYRGSGNDSDSTGAHLLERVEKTGHAEIVTKVDGYRALVDALGGKSGPPLSDSGVHSLLCVPLIARGRAIGSLTLAASRTRPAFSDVDLVGAEDFGSRLALAMDNALLYRTAERAIGMRDNVLAIVSHDLRTPLGIIMLEAEALSQSTTGASVGVSILRSARRMHRLIGDLLDASAINAGRLTLDMATHAPAEIAHEALDMFRSQADARSVTLVDDIGAELPVVRCDRDRIVQVLSNLLDNALKFTPAGGKVILHVRCDDKGVRFEVEDTGQGVAPEQVPYLFDRFWRGQSKRGGAGLGLFIAQGIMHAHASSLHVSTTAGAGSHFFFTLASGA